MLLRFAIFFVLLNLFFVAKAQEEEEVLQDTIIFPTKKPLKEAQSVGELVGSEKFLMNKDIFSGNVSYSFGRVTMDDCPCNRREIQNSLSFLLTTKFYKNYTFTTTLFKHFNKAAVAPWTPDFTYTIANYNYESKSISYGYENYLYNKYNDSGSELFEKFQQGFYFVSYTYELPERLTEDLKKDSTFSIRVGGFVRYATHYRNSSEELVGGLVKGKPIVGASLRNTFAKKFYAEVTAQAYFSREHKLPWDPDFTYGLGYFDYRPFRFSIIYGNWIANRYPWNVKEIDHSVPDGVVILSFNYRW